VGKQANWIGWSRAIQGFLRELPETAFENEFIQLWHHRLSNAPKLQGVNL